MSYIFTVGKYLGDDCHPDVGCYGAYVECIDNVCQCNPPFFEVEGICGKEINLDAHSDFISASLLKATLEETTFEVIATQE